MYKLIPSMSTVFSRSLHLIFAGLIFLCTHSTAQQPEIIPGEFVVKVRSGIPIRETLSGGGTGVRALDDALDACRVHSVKRFCPPSHESDPYGMARIVEVSADPDMDPAVFVSRLQSLKEVEYAEPKYRKSIKRNSGFYRGQSFPMGGDELPNDPFFPLQWALPYINAPAAWDIVTGDSAVVIANVDLGVDLDHPDLAQILWRNLPELEGTPGVDDDGNGWIDDIYGWDFVDDDPDPRPSEGDFHGTHTAATAIAATDDGIGVAGIARDCRLMSVRAGTGSEIFQGYTGIYYAAHSGAKVISLSWGGYGYSQFEQDVVMDAQAHGCVLVAAAGNESTSSEHYPSAFDAVVGVAAIDQTGQKAEFSNYGIWVDIAAPGVNILSAIPGNDWAYASGTSMAAPVVAGVAALVASLHPEWDSQELISAVIASGEPIDDSNPFFGSGLGAGAINAFRAVDGGRGGIALDSIIFDDSIGGDGDAIPDPGESIRLLAWIRNDHASETLVTGEIMADDPGLTITANLSNFGAMPSGQSASNAANPFQFSIDPSAQRNQRFRLALELRDQANRRLRRIPIQFVVGPSYGDHDVGNVILTVTSFGSFGYLEYLIPEYAEPRGSGFKYPHDGLSWLYHASLMVGADQTHVSDNAYGDASFSRHDFLTTPDGDLSFFTPGISDQDAYAQFSDSIATNPIGITVTQRSYAWADPDNDDYVILEAEVQNSSILSYDSIYIALYADFDIGPYLQNLASWDPDHQLAYMSNPVFPSPIVGIARIDGSTASFRVVDNSNLVYLQGFPDHIKYQYMSHGIITDYGQSQGDWSLFIAAGPFSLSPGQSTTTVFSLAAGDDLTALQQHIDAARSQYSQIRPGFVQKSGPIVSELELMPPYPNPFNSVARIQLVAHHQTNVHLALYNILGQRIVTIFQGTLKEGLHSFDINNSTIMSSGMYYCRLDAPGIHTTRPVALIK